MTNGRKRRIINRKAGKTSTDIVYGTTNHTPQATDAQRLLAVNRSHSDAESFHYTFDWLRDEDRGCLCAGPRPVKSTIDFEQDPMYQDIITLVILAGECSEKCHEALPNEKTRCETAYSCPGRLFQQCE